MTDKPIQNMANNTDDLPSPTTKNSANFSLVQLKQAERQGIISPIQYQQLSDFLQATVTTHFTTTTQSAAKQTPQFMLSHFLYYFGGLIAMGAMSLLMTLGFELYGGVGIMLICVCYAVVGMALARYFKVRDFLIPQAICLTFVLCLVPLFVFGLQKTLGIWVEYEHYQDYYGWISWQWVYLELSTLVVGVVMLWRYRQSFLMLPMAISLWFLSMDIAPFFAQEELTWELRQWVSLYFGLLMVGLAIWVDIRQMYDDGQDYAFWLYIFGVMTFWGGLTLMDSHSEWSKFGYFCINMAMMLVGFLLLRRVFVVFGGLGVAFYLGHLSYDVFKDSMIFPLLLTFVGLAVVFAGVIWQKHEYAIHEYLLSCLPKPIQKTLQKIHVG